MVEYKKRAMTSGKARQVRAKGHADAKLFAKSIDLADDYQNDPKAKKDVIDKKGDSHSVKSGDGYWQIFLYSLRRFENDNAFKAMNGIGQIMIDCIKAIPKDKNHYQNNKSYYKQEISKNMIRLKDKLLEKYRLEAFLEKSIFNSGEVNYLTIKHLDKFHVFLNRDVIDVFSKNFMVSNSSSVKGSIPNQKVIFKLDNKNCGEIEMRNGEKYHHKEMKFRLHKVAITELLISTFNVNKQNFNDQVIVYGNAIKKFI